MIIFDKVSKHYPTGDHVLNQVSFEISPQELVIVEGPSGSGKTTLLRLIHRDIDPTEGKIIIDGQDVTNIKSGSLPLFRRKIGFAFQDFKLIPDKTVWENIALSLEIAGFTDALIKTRLDNLLDLTGMTSKSLMYPRQLSGGEIQRVCLARAVATEPSILLADEPTGNLDLETGDKIIDLISQINKLGTTVVMATHNQDAINRLKARRITLKDGSLVSDTGSNHKTTSETKDSSEASEVKSETDHSEVKPPSIKKKSKIKSKA